MMSKKMYLLILLLVKHCQGFMNIDQFIITNQTKHRLNLTCQYYDGRTSNCEYCVYQYFSNGSSSMTTYDCIEMINTYRSVSDRCQGFSDQHDIGYGICSPLEFETLDISILCICATNMCNENLHSCQSSVTNQLRLNSAPSVLRSFLPQLKTPISCSNTKISVSDSLNASYYCLTFQSPYINQTKCEEYLIKNTVLCMMIMYDNDSLLIPLTIDNYEMALAGSIANIFYLSQNPQIKQFYNESSSYFYIYSNITDQFGNLSNIEQRCFCAQDNCNMNLSSCLNANRSLIITNKSTRKELNH